MPASNILSCWKRDNLLTETALQYKQLHLRTHRCYQTTINRIRDTANGLRTVLNLMKDLLVYFSKQINITASNPGI